MMLFSLRVHAEESRRIKHYIPIPLTGNSGSTGSVTGNTGECVVLSAPLKIRCKTSEGGNGSHLILQRYVYKTGFGAARLDPTNSSGSNS